MRPLIPLEPLRPPRDPGSIPPLIVLVFVCIGGVLAWAIWSAL